MKKAWICLGLLGIVTGCSGAEGAAAYVAKAPPGALTTTNMHAVKCQKATCAGPGEKTFNIDVIEHNVDLGLGTTFAAWTYNGRIPAPTLETCEGDKVTINVTNKGTTAHGLDTHAMKIDARH